MRTLIQSLPDHLVNPFTGRFNETQAERLKSLVDMGPHAEKYGFWGYTMGEHHCDSMFVGASPQMMLAAVAAKTSRLKVAGAVVVLPLCDPLRIAEEYAQLDLISNGRAMMGVGSGITNAAFALFGLDVADAAQLSNEKIDRILTLWSERNITVPPTKFLPGLNNVTLMPRTFHDRPLPVFRACARVETAINAGRRGEKASIHTIARTFGQAKEVADAYREAYTKAGHDPANMSVAITVMLRCVSGRGDQGRDNWHRYIDNYFSHGAAVSQEKWKDDLKRQKAAASPVDEGIPQPGKWHPSHIYGSADEILEMLGKRYEQMGGWDELVCIMDNGGQPREEVFDSIQSFGETVIPRLHEIDGKPVNASARKVELICQEVGVLSPS